MVFNPDFFLIRTSKTIVLKKRLTPFYKIDGKFLYCFFRPFLKTFVFSFLWTIKVICPTLVFFQPTQFFTKMFVRSQKWYPFLITRTWKYTLYTRYVQCTWMYAIGKSFTTTNQNTTVVQHALYHGKGSSELRTFKWS